VIVDLAEALVAELFIKRKRLEGEGIKPDADAAVFECGLFGSLHEGASEAGASEVGGNCKVFDEEPVVSSAAPETSDGFRVRALNEQGQGQMICRRSVLEVELCERCADGGQIFSAGLLRDDDFVVQIGQRISSRGVLLNCRNSGVAL
jgi:hypothetical protein